jgi:hypothetical protein
MKSFNAEFYQIILICLLKWNRLRVTFSRIQFSQWEYKRHVPGLGLVGKTQEHTISVSVSSTKKTLTDHKLFPLYLGKWASILKNYVYHPWLWGPDICILKMLTSTDIWKTICEFEHPLVEVLQGLMIFRR